uniref:Cytoplasmic dynein 2 heavy chain 1 n=1 Tax=Globodera rostochiensis TaxID=31243 RepID=A0A914HVR0_GLORO
MSRRENATGGGSDQRKAYLLKVASHILSLNLTEERLPNATALNAFCDSEAPLLVISRRDQKGHVDVSNEVSDKRSAMLRVLFYKNRNQPLALDDYKQKVSVLSMHENAGQTLLGTLKQVFSRFLAEDQLGRADGNASQLASLVSELEGTLQNNFGEDGTEDSAGGVQSVRSEIELWRKKAQKATEPAQSYSEALEPLADKLATLEGEGPLDELYEVCEAAEESAEGLWNVLDDPYPQRRMRQLIICIAASLQRAISHRVASNISPSALFRSSETLRLALNLATHWCDLVELLTGRSWAQNALHQWEGEPIGLEIFQRFRKRIEEAHSLATLGEQIVQLSDRRGDSQVRERIFGSIEGAMRDSTPFGTAAGEQWTERLEAAGRALDSFIEQIVPTLRAQLQFQPSVGWELILDELNRYRHFLARKQVKAKLQTEREVLITQLSEQLRSRRREIERFASAAIPTGKFLTEIAAKIAWIRNNSVQVDKLSKASSKFFNDLPIYASFEQSLLSLAEELKTAEQEQFDAWCRDMLAHVDDPGGDSISLQTTGRLMVLERDRGVLNVSYSDRLARLLREVAQLQAMGLKVPAKIIQCVRQGEKFYQYGVLLKQVAHFYNTIEQQMLPCQQAMLLDEALAFERLVLPSPGGKQREERGAAAVNITWENPEKLKQYINKLREAAFNLTNHNRRLRKAHAEITQIVAELGHVDLLREEEKWSAKLIEIRQKFVDEERFVAVKSNMQPWANHWNRQLYKVLQLQFRWAMEDIDSQIPTLNAQLVFRDERLQFRPPLEELRQQYYKGLRKLLSTPQRLRGVQNNTREMELFGRIVARNASRFHQLYLRSEEMFERLRTIDRNFDEWVALAQVNLEDLLEQNLHNASDWEHQLNLLKQKQRSAERIPNEIRVDCVRVSTAGVRTFALDLLKRFHDALSWTLRHSIRTELQSVEQTLSQGVDKLSKLPESLEEVAEANYTQSTLAKSSKVIRTKIYNIEEKDQLLRSLFGSDQGVDSVPLTKDQFTHFLSLLEGHELVMRDQVNVMKEKVRESLQKLGDDLEKLHSLWNQFKPRSEIFTSQDDRMALVKAVEFIRGKRQEFDAIVKRMNKVRMECEQFELEQSEWPLFVELNEDLEQYESNYLLYEDFSNELQPLAEQEWVLFRSKTYLFDEFLQKWLEKLKETSGSNVAVRLRKDIEQMREFSNSLKFCRGEVFSADHWLEMFRLLKLPRGTNLERLTFGELLNCQQTVLNNVEKLKEMNARAHGEVSIREAIQELEMWAAQAEFALADYRHSDGTTLKVVKEWKTVLNQVRDNHALLQSLRSSPYYVQFREQVHLWERRVTDLDLQLHALNDIQRRWVYLEPIFSRGALPSETARFNRIDAEFRAILNDIAADNRIMALNAKNASLGRTLEQLVDQLGRCQRALSSFLEEKRTAFPRFYFLGDDDLLEIVGQSTNPAVIQSHLKKLFQGINRVVFDAEQQSIRAIVSAEGEIVQMLKPVQIVPRVEQWLSALSEEMRNTLKRLVVDCLQEKSLDPARFPSQVLCLTEQIRFCSDVEKCMASIAGTPGDQLAAYRRQLIGQLEQLNSANAEEAIVRLKLKSLVFDVTHHVGVVDQLLRTDNNGYIGCWAWQRQLRFYLVSGLVVVRQAEYEFAYTYEYQGNGAKLVHTPLTDKCYLTLTQALGMGLGGNPYGPAGTGKTESVKSLAGLLGRQVLVFNCDEGIDVQAIGRIFVGLIQCGAWGCFDEFNRLGRGVLSAVSSQVQLIQEAVRTKASHCQIGDVSVPVDFNSAIFVTLNPAGKGYGGRQRLPDNLKQLFRPVAMSVPDNQQISETLLFAEGFGQAKLLAKKLVTAFGLAKEMLSAQQHYDWGLRALKTVLKGCADAIGKQRQKTRQRLSEQEEMELVVQNLQLNTLSKLTFADSRRFRVLLDGIFPGTKRETAQFDELFEHIQKASELLQLQTTDVQLQKLSELYEQLRQRIGVIIVGPPGSGKSTLWRLLQKTLSLSGAQTVDVYSMDPKAMPRGRLLGHLDLDTREWTDGTLTQAARLATKDPNKPAWIVCDGDVDPEWIESLNSVLDDNKLLTLPSGERIQFGPNVNFLFECVDLTYASPATISRMGMILMSHEDLEVQTLIDRFIYRNEKELPAQFVNWLNQNLVPALNWTIMHQTREFACSQIGILKNALSLVQNAKTKNQFLVGLLRAFAPFVEPDARRELCQGVIFQGATVPDPKTPLNVYCDARTDTLLSYSDDIGLPIQLDEFRRRPPVVLSVRMQIVRDILMEWLRPKSRERPPANSGHLEPILLLGPEGCGKQSLLRECFEGAGMQAQKLLLNMHCSANTTANHLEQLLYEHCVQVSGPSGRCLKPRENEQLVLHLKGPNLARPDQYGTSQLIAFLEQMVEYRGFYDRSLEWIGLDNVQLVISISNTFNAERFALPERFTSKLRVLSMDGPSETELKTIYAAYLAPILGKQPMNSQAKAADSLAGSLTNVFVELTKVFTPNEQFHYVFTPSDLTNWTNGLLRYGVGADSAALYSFINFECQRIFGDRLVSAEHRQHFQNILQEHFPVRSASNFAPLPGPILAKELDGRPMLPISREDYIGQLEKVINRLKHEQHCPTQQLSNAFVDMCLSVDRAITCPGGAVLLAGRAGMGRRAAVTFVAQMHQMRLHTLRVSSSYTSRNFAQDLKEAIYSACVDAEQVVLLVEDYQLLEESFLQLINALLSDGYVPGLYGTQQELDQILGRLRESSMDDGFSGAGSLHAYFAHRVRSNLHLALLMDVAHPKFVPRILSNPALYKRCIMIWHESWSPETLSQIASLSLKQNGVEQPPNSLLSAFVQLFVRAPAECRSPAKFSGFVGTFHALLNSKRAAVEKRLARLRAGVDRLTETRNAVAKLQKKAAKKSKLLAEKQAEANSALGQITQSMSGATEQKEDMEKLKSATEAENVKIEEQKKLIEQQLADVEPLLNEARKAVGSLKSEHLSEVRSLRSPATSIRDILEAVLLFMGILDTSWESMRRFLAKSGVKEEVINFDVRRITPSTAKKVGTLVKSKAASFDPINAKNASTAIAPLAAWVTANLQYALILEKIAPLEQKKESLVKNLDAAEHQMERLSKGLKSLDKKVTGLKTNFESCMKEATEIKIELDREQATIVVAGKLVERLGGEYSRWQQQQKVLEDELRTVENCCLIGAAFITFLGGASEEMRAQTMGHWRGVCQLPAEFDLLNFLASETDQLRWKLEGLLTNNLALENGAILFGAKNSPFIVDPSGTVCTFLANHFKGSSTEVLRANQSDLMTQVELGVRFGKTLIIDEMDELVEPALVPLLRRDFHTIGARLAVQLGEKQVDFNDQFRLFLCTRNEHCHLASHVSSVVAEINFSITRSGLASQLLSLAIELEKPELEQSSAQLSSQMEGLKLEMDSLEQVLLEQLAVSGGSLLDNTSLLESLNESKEKADKVSHGLSDLQRLRALTDSQRDTFLPFAQRCAQLYFAVRPFHTVKHCYQFSVNDSVALFRKCFVESNERQNASEGQERLDRVFRRLRLRLFEFVSRSLFKEDRLTFGMQFVHATASNAGGSGTLFGRNEWELFTKVLPPPGEPTSSANLGWLDRERRAAIERIQLHLPALFQCLQIGDQPTWATFMKSVECENAFPASVNAKLSDFQRLIVLQALRPDRLHVGMLRFTSKLLGVDSLRGASLDFASIHQRESVPQQPILLLIAPGSSADLSAELADYAHGEFAKASSGQKLHQLAMGEGQAESTAVELLRNSALGGHWLCLYNVHLTPSIVGRLMTELGSLSDKLHANFRLWLTAEPDDQLPVVFLQACLKATYETPPGLKKNLERNFVGVTDERAATRRGPAEASKAKSLFVLHWLHAVMQERRNFIPQAWLKAYEFSEADLRTAKMTLQSLFGIVERNNLKGVDWEMFRGLMLNAIYGGRIEVELDNRVLLAFLLELFNFNMIDGAGGELAPGLKMPLFGEQKGFVDWISSTLPETDRPELMFLPRNIMLSWDLVQSDAAIAKLRRLFTAVALSQQIAPSVEESSDTKIFSKRLWNDSLGPILSLWKKLNQQNPQLLQSAQEEQKQRPISASRSEKAHPTVSGHEEDPLVEMLQLEFVYSLKMLHCIHSSLSAISRAIKGVNLPEKCTIELAQSLINFQIPTSWDALWSGGPSVPAQYLEELIYKVRSTQTLLSQAKSQQLLSVPVSLGQLFRPATLLNAFRQYSARKLVASLDELELCTHWHGAVQQMADNAAAPKMTLNLLCIQGALFDGVELRPVTPSAAPFSSVPQLDILWAKINSNAPAETENQLLLPLFADAERREAPVIEVKVPCSPASKNLWTLAGVALFLSGQPE